jgi:hypothetical protein
VTGDIERFQALALLDRTRQVQGEDGKLGGFFEVQFCFR